VVLLMAVANRGEIAKQMMDGGCGRDTAVAVIESGTGVDERRTLTTLAQLGDTAMSAPAVIVIGAVAQRLRELPTDSFSTVDDVARWIELSSTN
jgi:siroheme synthase